MEKAVGTDNKTQLTCKLPEERSLSRSFGAIVGLQFLTAAAFGFMSPIISIILTEYFARLHRDGMPIDCGAESRNEACIKGSQEAAWFSSLFSATGSVVNFILAPVLGQASDVYGRKPFLVLSQIARVGTPFFVMYMMHPAGSIVPYFVLRLVDYGFGTAGVLSAAVADVVTPENRAAAFGVLFASLSVGYSTSAFIASLFSREHILQITAALFVARVLWAMIILPETLPTRERMSKIRWVLESPISSMSILVRNKLFMRLTCLIALTSFVTNGISQIEPFYLNTIVGFDVKNFGMMRLLGGALALLGQGLLLQPLVSCFKEKGVIIISMIATWVNLAGFAGTAFYSHKWVVYASCMPGLLSDLSFPAIAALKSINVSDKEQGRLQGAIYGARSVFAALGPIIFSSLYASMKRQSRWTQALPYVVAASIYVLGVGMALSLPVSKLPSTRKLPAVPDALPSPTRGDSLSSSSVYFETDDDATDEGELDASYANLDNDENHLAEPLLGGRSSPAEV